MSVPAKSRSEIVVAERSGEDVGGTAFVSTARVDRVIAGRSSLVELAGYQKMTDDEQPRKIWRRGSESNRRIKVLQTSPLPLGYRALAQYVSVP